MDMNIEHTDKWVRKISWSSIIIGALVAIGLSILFNVLTLGIGLSAVTNSREGAVSLMVGSFLWLFIGTYITLFVAGWVTGFLAKNCTQNACHGALYGFVMWSLAFVVCLVLSASTAGSILFTISKMATFLTQQFDSSAAVHQAHKVGVATLSAFFILLSGALGSCIGGYFGIKHETHQQLNKK